MFLDILIVAYPMRLYHVTQPIGFAACFGVFSIIYYFCGGKNLYVHIIDWSLFLCLQFYITNFNFFLVTF